MFGRKSAITPGYDIWTQWGGNGGGIYNPNMGDYEDIAPAQGPVAAPRQVQAPMLDTSLPQDPYANERPAEAPGFFGKGRKFRDAIGYGLGAFAEALSGAENPYRTAMNEDRRAKNELVQAQLLARLRAQEQDMVPQAVNLGDGGFATYTPSGGLNVIREPNPNVAPTALRQNIDMIRELRGQDMSDADAAALAERALLAGNSDYAFKQRERLKQIAPPRAAGGGGSPMTGNQRAKIIAEAQAAIAAGADPNAVRARLQQMGVQ